MSSRIKVKESSHVVHLDLDSRSLGAHANALESLHMESAASFVRANFLRVMSFGPIPKRADLDMKRNGHN